MQRGYGISIFIFMVREGLLRTSRDACLIFLLQLAKIESSVRYIRQKGSKAFSGLNFGRAKKVPRHGDYIHSTTKDMLHFSAGMHNLRLLFLREHVSSPSPTFHPFPVEANVIDKLHLANAEQKFEWPYTSLVGKLLYL